MNNYKTLFLIIGLAVFMTACSNDVFIDGLDMPDEQTATVEGDGGHASFAVDVRGLDRISVDLLSEQQRNITYYNYSGEIITRNSPASDVGKIVFDNSRIEFIITKEGNRLYFESVTNTIGDASWIIRLDYNYTVKFVEVDVLAGKPMELLSVDYTTEVEIKERAETKTFKSVFNNNGESVYTIELRPYLNAQASILVEPDYAQTWVNGEEFTIPVPVYIGGQWQMQPHKLRPGTSYKYSRPDYMMVDRVVEVAPYSSVSIYEEIIYDGAVCRGTMRFVNPVTDRRIDVDFKCTSLYPVSYEIHLENAK